MSDRINIAKNLTLYAELKDRIRKLEWQGAVDRSTCTWCGTIHARRMNTLCPLTIAEAKLAAIEKLPEKWMQRAVDRDWDSAESCAWNNAADELQAKLKQEDSP